jgi:HEAT repeat protein
MSLETNWSAQLYSPNLRRRRAAVMALAQQGEAAVPTLITVLLGCSRLATEAAEEALVRIGAPAAPALCEVLTAGNGVRWGVRAATALTRIGPAAIPALTALARSPRGRLRCTAVSVMGRIPGSSSLAPLVRALRDPYSAVRWRAAQALGQIGAPVAVDALLGALRDSEGEVRRRAAQALMRIGDPRAAPAVLEVLLQSSTGWTLTSGEPLEPALSHWVAQALASTSGSSGVLSLLLLLSHEAPAVRLEAIRSLERRAAQQPCRELLAAVPELRQLARARRGELPETRKAAETALIVIERTSRTWRALPLPPNSVLPILQVLPLPVPEVRALERPMHGASDEHQPQVVNRAERRARRPQRHGYWRRLLGLESGSLR